MASKAITTHRIHFRQTPAPTVVLNVTPAVIAAPGGKVPGPWSDVLTDIYHNGTYRTPQALYCPDGFDMVSLKGQSGTDFENLRFQFKNSGEHLGFRFRGSVDKTVTVNLEVQYGGHTYSGHVQIAYIPETPESYELFSASAELRFDSEGKPNRSSVGVTPYRLKDTREQIAVNADSDEFFLILHTLTGGLTHSYTQTASVQAATLKSVDWARFDLIRKSDAVLKSTPGQTPLPGKEVILSYPESAILASCPILITHDGTNASDGGFVSIAFKRHPSNPGTPSGGTYTSPVPATDGWTDAPTQGTEPLWMSRAMFTPDMDGKTGSPAPVWSSAVSVADSVDIEFIFSKSLAPETPTGHPFMSTAMSSWTKTPDDAIWMAISAKVAGVWCDWKVSRIKGEQGPPGNDGRAGPPVLPPMLWDKYTDGSGGTTPYDFQDGVTDITGQPASRLDCVLIENTAPLSRDEFPLIAFRCIKPHYKAADKKPGAETAPDGPYWKEITNRYTNVATDLLLAKNGFICIFSSQSIFVYKADGKTVNAAFAGGSYPAWFGADNPKDAPTKISDDGTIYSKKGEFEGDVVFGGRVKPMVTRITSANYTAYRARWNDVFNDDSQDNIWILDFRTLSGNVILEPSLSSVSSSQLALYMIVACQYQTASASVKRGIPEEYIGSRMRIENNTSKPFSLTGLITTDRSSLTSGISPSVQPGHEIDLECFVKAAYGKRAIGWYIEYQGPIG